MAEEGGKRTSSRNRRPNTNKFREDMYLYDLHQNDSNNNSN